MMGMPPPSVPEKVHPSQNEFESAHEFWYIHQEEDNDDIDEDIDVDIDEDDDSREDVMESVYEDLYDIVAVTRIVEEMEDGVIPGLP